MADSELSAKLARRQVLNEESGEGVHVKQIKKFNPYTEFPEFSMKEIKEYEAMFKRYDVGRDGYIDLEELKRMMEILGVPQTHLALKQMIREVDEDGDGRISFREFLLIFKKAKLGELDNDSGLQTLAQLTEINVDETGVGGAKQFFEAKIAEQAKGAKFEEEIRTEQEERRLQEQRKIQRRAEFQEKAKFFEQTAT